MTQPALPEPPRPFANSLRPFKYEAQTADGLLLQGIMAAPSIVEVQSRLASMQLRVLSVEPATIKPRPWRLPIGPDDFLIFNQQLAHLAAAGLPVERGLRLIAVEMRSGRLARAAAAVAEELERGVPLSDAFSHHASRFPSLYGKLIDAGVQTGNLPAMLFSLGHHLELIARLRQTLWRTLAYPAMVLAILSGILLFLSLRVIPQFQDIFRDFRTTVPLLTQSVLDMAHWYPDVFAVGWGIIGGMILLAILLKLTGRSAWVADTLMVRIPLVGSVVRANLLSRWIDALRLAIDAGLDLPRSLALASESTASPRLARESRVLAENIAAGLPLDQSGRTLIPPTIPAAIELAAHSGDLPATLATLSGMYQRQAEFRLRLLPTILTPFTIFVLGATVAVVVIAMFLPLVKLIQSVSGGA